MPRKTLPTVGGANAWASISEARKALRVAENDRLALLGALGDVDRQRTRGTGLLPLGELGNCIYEETEVEARRIAERFAPLYGGENHPPLEVALALGGVRLVGRLDGIWDGGRVRARFSRLQEPWELDEWVRHLAFSAARPGDCL